MKFLKNLGLKLAGLKQTQYGFVSTSGLSTARWSARDYENFAKEAYIINFVSFRCIDLISQSVGSVPWSIFRKDGDKREELEDHPIKRILYRANPRMGFSMFNYAITAFLGLAGNSYIEKIEPETGPNKEIPKELQYYRPDRIRFKLNEVTKELAGYKYIVNGEIIKEWDIDPITQQCDLLHVKTFHPIDDIEGLSKVEPAAKSIDTSNEAMTWNKSLLENQGRPGMILQFDGNLGDNQFERLEKQLNSKFSGPEKAGKNLIVEGDMKDAKPYGFSPTEMDFLKGNWDLARQIAMVYGVPGPILGIPGESTFRNFEHSELFFWENTIFWYLMLWRSEYNNWLFPDNDDVFIDYILDDIPALSPRRKEKWEMVEKSNTLTINEKREEMGREKVEGGDVILVPSTQVPLDMVGVTEEEIDESEEEVQEEIEDEELQAMLLESKEIIPDEEKPFANEHA